MHAVLGPKGFKRKGYSWYRTVTPFTQVINIQIASYRTHATVNLGVHERRIFQEATGNEGRVFVDEAECIVRSRIGFLIGNVDKWWEIPTRSKSTRWWKLVRIQRLTFSINISLLVTSPPRLKSPKLSTTHILSQQSIWL
ncbi:DUF4304 domain-containing protein [Rhizobium sp. ZW T2_16]|uniref:DUF4304 domain-containing protein n=1 Tax=Rhizobium sp. ZW T2_16 TaxID=3378083 RepID=UPI0038529ED7